MANIVVVVSNMDALAGRTIRTLLPPQLAELAVVVGNDTLVEVAAVMTGLRCPLAVVTGVGTMIGVVTAARLLQLAPAT